MAWHAAKETAGRFAPKGYHRPSQNPGFHARTLIEVTIDMSAPLKAIEASADLPALMTDLASRARQAARALALAPPEQKNRALEAIERAIRAGTSAILAANAEDVAEVRAAGATSAFIDRLTLTQARVDAMADGVATVRAIKDPVGVVTERWTRPNGMLLGSVVPELRARAARLSEDLSELINLRKTIATERDHLASDRDRLRQDQTRLAALVDERQRKQSAVEKDMEAEGARALSLAKQVDSLQGLIAKMEQELKSAAKAAAAASQQAAPVTVNGQPNLGGLKDSARHRPAIAFASAKGLLALPANGVKIREFGSSDGAGGVEKGISLATRAGAQVTTPCDGWVVYAGPFRSYGQLLILNAGGGYHAVDIVGIDL